jgi:hypothetical protein
MKELEFTPDDEYKFLDLDLKLTLPQLVLAVYSPFDGLPFKDTRKWIKIVHQTAGIACHHPKFLGTILTPTKYMKRYMKWLSDKWYESNCGAFGATLDELAAYDYDLSDFSLSCNRSYKYLEEGLYPIDIEDDTLVRIAENKLPTKLDDLIDWKSDMDRFLGCIGRWNLFIVGENSD